MKERCQLLQTKLTGGWTGMNDKPLSVTSGTKQFLKKGSEDMDEMTTAELNQYLENIAKLIEAAATDPESAAKLVRDSKV